MALARVLGLAFLVLSLVSVLFILSHSSVLAQSRAPAAQGTAPTCHSSLNMVTTLDA